MAISGLKTINVGLPNEPAGSDSLYAAFTKIKENFTQIGSQASVYTNFVAGNGVGISANATTGIVNITNTGVTQLIAGSGVSINQATGAVTISAVGGGGTGGVTSVGILSSSLSVTNSPIVSSGNISVELPNLAVAGNYTNPSVTVDNNGRITAISNNTVSGTVTSIGLNPGTGIQVSGSPITTSGDITVTNTGVTRINAGLGISVSAPNGNVTISSIGPTGTVTSVGISSTNLTVTNSPITSSGSITVDLSANVPVTGRLTLSGSEDLADASAANLLVTASYFTTTTAETATLAAGVNGLIKTFMMNGDGGDMVITVTNAAWGGAGTMTFANVGDACTLQYINNKWFCIGNNGVVFA